MALKSTNPATGETLGTFSELSGAEIDERLERATTAFRAWRRTPITERATLLRRAADVLEADKAKYGRLITLEMGKTLSSAVAEVEKCVLTCRYYAEHAPAFLADEPIATEADSYIRYLPIGPVLAVMPWNFPFWQVFRFLAPALMAGNVCVLKHASNVPQCALAIDDVMRRAQAPAGAFQPLLIGSSKVAGVIWDPRIAAVTLTGSESAGIQVASAAGAALKKCVLELGGNDPFIVLPSADLDRAIATGVKSRMAANGQSCVCAKRFIVHHSVYDAFEEKFVAAVNRLKVGNPLLSDVDIGPLATRDAVDTLERQVGESVQNGARLLVGGHRIEGAGNFFMPTVVADIPSAAPIYREEVFGPVAMLFKADDLDQAIALANDTQFGLGSSAWTNAPDEQERCAAEIEAGQTFINAMVASDPRLPFGGIKQSGYGRELSALGMREFTNIKTIVRARPSA